MNKLGRLRVSCAIGYLAPARARPNLTIRANTFVRRLIIDGGRCTGVEVERARRIDRGDLGEARRAVRRRVAVAVDPDALRHRSARAPRVAVDRRVARRAGRRREPERPSGAVGGVPRQRRRDHRFRSAADPDDPALHRERVRQTQRSADRADQFRRPQRRTADVRDRGGARIPIRTRRAAVALGRSARHADRRQPLLRRRARHGAAGRLLQGCVRVHPHGPVGGHDRGGEFPDPARPLDDASIAALCRKFAARGFHPCGTAKMGPAERPDGGGRRIRLLPQRRSAGGRGRVDHAVRAAREYESHVHHDRRDGRGVVADVAARYGL